MTALLYIPIAIAFAWLNARWIKNGKRVYHGLNAILHIAAAVAAAWFDRGQSGIAVLFIARVFFDVSLNLFRGLRIDYISTEVKSYTGLRMAINKGKVIDYIEYKAFGGNGYIPKIIYVGIIIALMFI
jgi:hypothetical protein